ncbi:MAG: lysine exporter LysO family protein [Alistipes sp.]|nr:lysine exporter LysO family protein [Alistipes sp.]MBO5330957.1 lysine exporter LysO family protein [Alistipes sp.]MBP3601119.1 lysine exporter LysO family protein [Alistipes sp.]
MKGSLIIVGAFVIGCVAGAGGWLPEWLLGGDVTMWILYALMLQVGIGIGSDERLKEILRTLSPRLLLLPCATIAGTLIATLVISFLLSRWTTAEVLAVGSGMGYYSLSSILITSLKEPSIGVVAAAELGTIALMANIFREIMTLVFAPLMVRWFSPLGPISAGGATSMDVTLPVITRFSGKDWVFVSIVHGIVVDFSVPFLVPFFCSL